MEEEQGESIGSTARVAILFILIMSPESENACCNNNGRPLDSLMGRATAACYCFGRVREMATENTTIYSSAASAKRRYTMLMLMAMLIASETASLVNITAGTAPPVSRPQYSNSSSARGKPKYHYCS